MLSMPILDFFASFSEVGSYFASLLILFFFLHYTINNKIKLFDYKKYTSVILILTLLLAHALSIFNFNKTFFLGFAEFLNIHFLFLMFSTCLILIFLGVWLLNKIDKRIIFFPIGMLFVYSIYFLVQWHSFNQQKALFLDVYTVAVNEGIRDLKECNKKISCYVTRKDGDLSELISQTENPQIQKEYQAPIKNYLKKYQAKINRSTEELVYLSYLDDVYSFNNDFYEPLGVLNTKTQTFIVDYYNSNQITAKGYEFYKRITGTSSFFWMIFMHLILLFHFWLKNKRKNVK